MKKRNTPTGVGKTRILFVKYIKLWKHPHGRGEDSDTFRKVYKTLETPPRAWGRHSVTMMSVPTSGNTPTGVGKTDSMMKSAMIH